MKYFGTLVITLIVGCSTGHLQNQSDAIGQTSPATGAHESAPRQSGHSGMPMPQITIENGGVTVPFGLYEEFAVPYVEVMIGDDGPFRFGFDTGMSGTVMVRPSLAKKLGFPVVGQAIVGDASGSQNKPTDLVRIPNMRVAGMALNDVIAVAFEASAAHVKAVPEGLVGLLGRGLMKDYLLTINYLDQTISFEEGELDANSANVISFEFYKGVMQVDASLSDQHYKLLVDTGSRSSITLPKSSAAALPLDSPLVQSTSVSTVTNTYERESAILGGAFVLAGIEIDNPVIEFAAEHTPKLIGYEILKQFKFTIDQNRQLIRFTTKM